MRSARSVWTVCLFLLAVSVCGPLSSAQQASSPGAPPTPNGSSTAVVKDPQAISILNQALTAAGGAAAIRAIFDYTGSGNITYHAHQDVQGTVVVIGLRSTEFRMDANLPKGVRSYSVSNGVIATKTEGGAISRLPPQGPVPSSDAFPFQTPLFPASIAFPYRQSSAVVNNPRFNISYKGLTQIDGHSVHDIQLVPMLLGTTSTQGSARSSQTRDLFIDTSTLQLVMTRDIILKNVVYELHYSDYRAVNGIFMPYSITEEMGGQPTWIIELSQVSFNTGLQDSAFALQ